MSFDVFLTISLSLAVPDPFPPTAVEFGGDAAALLIAIDGCDEADVVIGGAAFAFGFDWLCQYGGGAGGYPEAGEGGGAPAGGAPLLV